jgi:hypothetical protein
MAHVKIKLVSLTNKVMKQPMVFGTAYGHSMVWMGGGF